MFFGKKIKAISLMGLFLVNSGIFATDAEVLNQPTEVAEKQEEVVEANQPFWKDKAFWACLGCAIAYMIGHHRGSKHENEVWQAIDVAHNQRLNTWQQQTKDYYIQMGVNRQKAAELGKKMKDFRFNQLLQQEFKVDCEEKAEAIKEAATLLNVTLEELKVENFESMVDKCEQIITRCDELKIERPGDEEALQDAANDLESFVLMHYMNAQNQAEMAELAPKMREQLSLINEFFSQE